MTKRRGNLIAAVLAVAVFLGAASARATIHNVSVGNFFFNPATVNAVAGDTVRWTWTGGVHSTTSDPGQGTSWDSGVLSSVGATFQFIFADTTTPGAYTYICTVHPLSMSGTINIAAPPTPPKLFTFLLDDDQELSCAGTGSTATGWGLAILNSAQTQLSIYVEHNVVGANAGHIHFGAPCVDGGAIRFGFTSAASPIHNTWNLTPTNVAELLAGNLYVNIHSPAFPNGEIRGQIVQAPIKFVFTLDETQALAAAGSNSFANGLGVCELNATSTALAIDVTHDVPNTIDGHVHFGVPGVEGAIRYGFANPQTPVNETWNLDSLNVKDLMQGELYINIHSTAFPSGEIRGQIVRQDIHVSSQLNGAKANGGAGTGSSATGFAVCTLSKDLKRLTIYCEHNVTSPIDGHVHFGAPNVEGPIRFGFASSVSPISATWNLTPANVQELLDGNLYINIHSTAFPSGEIRGQLVLDEEFSFSFPLDESQANACAGTGSPALGAANIELKRGGREMTINLTHNVGSPIDGHVHRGAPCVSGPILFGFSQFTSPIKEFWYLGAADIIDLFQKELYVNVHSTAFPVEEIRGQIDNPPPACKCGDADGSGAFSISDAVFLINYIFAGGPAPAPTCLGDADGSSAISISDAVYLINYIFAGGPAPHC